MAEAELRSAVADEAHARSEYESSAVYAPITGQVIQIHARAGEEPGASGILELGQTDRMYAVAEVYETDIRRVRPGQRATVVSDLLPHPVEGTVERIGMKVTQSAVLPGDPAAFADNRVIPVKIRLEDSAAVAGLINGKVSVVIHQ
jgi:HlyD family secretion protein